MFYECSECSKKNRGGQVCPPPPAACVLHTGVVAGALRSALRLDLRDLDVERFFAGMTLGNDFFFVPGFLFLVRLADRVIYHERSLRSAREFVTRCIREKGEITAPELRDKLGVTRKYAIAILEYLDNAQITRRLGDKRVLR